jgi:hypothetical protein
MSEIDDLKRRLDCLEAAFAAVSQLVVDLLEITHETKLDKLRGGLTCAGRALDIRTGAETPASREAERIRLALIQMAVVGLEGG